MTTNARSLSRVIRRLLHSRIGIGIAKILFRVARNGLLSVRTARLLEFDILRLQARTRYIGEHQNAPPCDQLHLGCGRRIVPNWLNVDIVDSQFDVDFGYPALPWPNASFRRIVSQQVIEHLDLETELLPLMGELRRICQPGAELWLSCPDMEKVCDAYFRDRGQDIVLNKRIRNSKFSLRPANVPVQHVISYMFHQNGEHKNLFDFETLTWIADQAGFNGCELVTEKRLLEAIPEFPVRNDDDVSLYVRITV